jgi:hypothetical protein
MRYPNEYVWFVLVSSMDIMLTWAILTKREGVEVNPLARLVIDTWNGLWPAGGLVGAIGFKFALMLFVIIACEIVGRRRDQLGRRLARLAVLVSALPVGYSLLLLLWHAWRPVVEGG